MAGPLSHIRVLDLSRIMAGPWAGQILADLGADVVKVERPGAGDDTRGWGPPFLKDKAGRDTSDAGYFLSVNRGKRSIAVDLADAEGQGIVRALAARADIVLENFKAGALAKYGLGYEDLGTVNPALIYCSITGFGQSGPRRDQAAYDFMIQGMSGLMSVTGEADGKPGRGPQKVGVPIVDIMTGMYAAIAVLAALARRQVSGQGEHVDIGMLDVGASFLANQAMNYLISGRAPRRAGNAHPNIQPQDVFATRDGHLVLAVGNDDQFARFCDVLERPGHRPGRTLPDQCRPRPQQCDPDAADRRAAGAPRARPLGARVRARGRAVRADQHRAGGFRRRADQASRNADRDRASGRGRRAAGGIADAVQARPAVARAPAAAARRAHRGNSARARLAGCEGARRMPRRTGNDLRISFRRTPASQCSGDRHGQQVSGRTPVAAHSALSNRRHDAGAAPRP